jgi:hypothetical protein
MGRKGDEEMGSAPPPLIFCVVALPVSFNLRFGISNFKSALKDGLLE